MKKVVTEQMIEEGKKVARKFAYYTATLGKGSNKRAAIEHCKKLGIDIEKPFNAQQDTPITAEMSRNESLQKEHY